MNQSDFLDRIRSVTQERVALAKNKTSLENLKATIDFSKKPVDLIGRFRVSTGAQIIAEVKRKSPSKGDIALELDPIQTALAYKRAGAIAISVLTEPEFFGGQIEDLAAIRTAVPSMPLLRKDFILDSYQLFEARAAGADVVLLIRSFLEKSQTQDLFLEAQALGLQILVEVHDEQELQEAEELGALLIGINNRNLRTLKVDLATSRNLLQSHPKTDAIYISESGIETTDQIQDLFELGFQGFLVGTKLTQDLTPEESLRRLRSGATK